MISGYSDTNNYIKSFYNTTRSVMKVFRRVSLHFLRNCKISWKRFLWNVFMTSFEATQSSVIKLKPELALRKINKMGFKRTRNFGRESSIKLFLSMILLSLDWIRDCKTRRNEKRNRWTFGAVCYVFSVQPMLS